jgi:8-oxo-dGTP diphosphatase
VQPLADRVGLPVTELPGLHEAVGFAEPTAWVRGTFAPIGEAIGGAWAAGRGAEVLFSLAARHPGGRVVASSHGDIIPATLSFLAAAYACPLPAIVGRGGWYRLRLEHGTLSMTSHRPAPTA